MKLRNQHGLCTHNGPSKTRVLTDPIVWPSFNVRTGRLNWVRAKRADNLILLIEKKRLSYIYTEFRGGSRAQPVARAL